MSFKKCDLKKLFRIQLFLHTASVLIGLLARLLQGKTNLLSLIIFMLLLLLLSLLKTYKSLPRTLDKGLTWLQLICLPFTIASSAPLLIYILPDSISYPFICLILLYFLLALIPLTQQLVLPNIRSCWSKLLISFIWYYFYSTSPIQSLITDLNDRSLLYQLLTSGLWTALALFLTFIFLMRQEGFPWPDWKSRQEIRISNLLVIGLIFMLILLPNIFAADSQNLWKFVSLQAFQIPSFKLTWLYIFTAFQAGLGEEIWLRYFILLSLLTYFGKGNSLNKSLYKAISLSSVIFGSLHLMNLFRGEDLSGTLEQTVYATAIGIFFALIYLYSGKLALPITFHTLLNLVGYASTSSMQTESVTAESLFICFGLIVIIALFSLYMLTGQRFKVIKSNAEFLLDQQKSQQKL